MSCPNLDAYDVASSLLHIQFTQAATNGFNGISVKYNEPLDATVCVNISGPMGSSGGYRISAFDRDRSDGHIKNLTTGDDVNGQESSGVRGRFDFSLSDDLMATLTAEHPESESNCCHRPYRDVPAGANFLGAVPGAFALGPVSPSDDNDEVAVDDATTDESESVCSGGGCPQPCLEGSARAHG